MPYCVGIDGGGTKTAVELRWSDYSSNTRAVFGPLNCNSDRPATAKTLADTMAWLAAQPGGLSGCGALCIGSAGISNPDAYHFLESGGWGHLIDDEEAPTRWGGISCALWCVPQMVAPPPLL